MSQTQITLPDPTTRGSNLSKSDYLWALLVQSQLPLVEVDSSSGAQVITLPPAGLNSSTGQTAQNQELIYIKTSADAHSVTINGAVTGSVSFTSQYASARFKSDGTSWFSVTPLGLPPSGAAGGDLSGTYPNPTVAKVNGGAIPLSKTVVGTNGAGQLIDASGASFPPSGAAGGDLSGTYPNPTVAKVNGGAIPLSKTIVGTDGAGRIVDATGATLSNNTSGTAANLSGTPTLPNGTKATTQSPGDDSQDLATTAYCDAPASGGTPIVNIPFGIGGVLSEAQPGATVLGAAGNVMFFVYFVCLEDITLNNVYVSIGTGLGGASMGIALYSATGTKLGAADGFSVATNGIKSQALSATVNLLRKTGYFLGWTVTSAVTLTVLNVLMGSTTGFQGLFNARVVRSGSSATPTSGGVTLSAVGAIVSAQLRIPVLYFD